VILGIDAAWTERGSSAVDVLRYEKKRRHIVAVAPSYSSFIGLGLGRPVTWTNGPGGAADVTGLLGTAQLLAGSQVDVTAIDMPMSRNAIKGYASLQSSFARASALPPQRHTNCHRSLRSSHLLRWCRSWACRCAQRTSRQRLLGTG
jgi:hypothetical protein